MKKNVWLVCAFAACVVGQSACSVRRIPAQAVGAGEPAERVAEDAWPERETQGLPSITAEREVDLSLETKGPGELVLLMTAEGVPCGQGWIHQVQLESRGVPNASGPMWFEYSSWHCGAAPLSFEPVSKDETLLVPALRTKVIETADYHQAFTLLMPDRGEPVGLVIHAFSLSTSKNELAVTDELHRRGWAVLRTTQVSFQSGDGPKRERTVPPADAAHPDTEAQLKLLGRALEALLADYAYASEAAAMYVQERRATLRGKPIVVVGFSMGAIMAPTLSARLGDQVGAVVMIGGGADLLGIVTESPVVWWLGPIASLRGNAGSARFAEIDREYRETAKLDPYSTAASLRGRPVLMVHAEWDSIVPAEYGDLLWERAGRPERWVFRGGHIPLFWNIGSYSSEIADWVEGAVGRSRETSTERQ